MAYSGEATDRLREPRRPPALAHLRSPHHRHRPVRDQRRDGDSADRLDRVIPAVADEFPERPLNIFVTRNYGPVHYHLSETCPCCAPSGHNGPGRDGPVAHRHGRPPPRPPRAPPPLRARTPSPGPAPGRSIEVVISPPDDDPPSDVEPRPSGGGGGIRRRTGPGFLGAVGTCLGCLARRRIVTSDGYCAECDYFAERVRIRDRSRDRDRPAGGVGVGVGIGNGVRYIPVRGSDPAARREMRDRMRERERERERERARWREIEREIAEAEMDRARARDRGRYHVAVNYYSDSDADSGLW
ncbi:hypothetical protein VTK56DRAFT_10127 [Thermocarpiscus australiensis]